MPTFHKFRIIIHVLFLGFSVAGCATDPQIVVKYLKVDSDSQSTDRCGMNETFGSALIESGTASNFYFHNIPIDERNWYGATTHKVRQLEDYSKIYEDKLSWIAKYVYKNATPKSLPCASQTNFTALIDIYGEEYEKQWSLNSTIAVNGVTCIAAIERVSLFLLAQSGIVLARLKACYDPVSLSSSFHVTLLNTDGWEVDASSAINQSLVQTGKHNKRE